MGIGRSLPLTGRQQPLNISQGMTSFMPTGKERKSQKITDFRRLPCGCTILRKAEKGAKSIHDRKYAVNRPIGAANYQSYNNISVAINYGRIQKKGEKWERTLNNS